ncbi:hypothetical protein [Devosia elaeis]|uniref:Uncharacterized protein n=1 Tax=Devosia elaeis TaxID=1770058 RepID=A0A178HLU9_9HYPH|nr:hypothetical protein [Devosia elaeis]OAM73519.1 hypothetical protein A3840_17950 [Devosia elaeis]
MELLSSLAAANPAHRIQKPNSEPRRVGIFGLGPGGAALVDRALQAGVATEVMTLDAVEPQSGIYRRPASMPDLNAVVVVARPEDDTTDARRIYAWAGMIGILVSTVVVSEDDGVIAGGPNVHTLRTSSDLLAMTTDDSYLPTMLQWIGSSN